MNNYILILLSLLCLGCKDTINNPQTNLPTTKMVDYFPIPFPTPQLSFDLTSESPPIYGITYIGIWSWELVNSTLLDSAIALYHITTQFSGWRYAWVETGRLDTLYRYDSTQIKQDTSFNIVCTADGFVSLNFPSVEYLLYSPPGKFQRFYPDTSQNDIPLYSFLTSYEGTLRRNVGIVVLEYPMLSNSSPGFYMKRR
jgi:hypothetical protein